MTFPTGDLSDAGAESSLALGADLMYTFTPALTVDGNDDFTATWLALTLAAHLHF